MTTSHDTIVRRLANILVKFNQGEKLNPHELAKEFDVTLRTIQRDLNERFIYLPIQKTDGLYHLEQAYLGKLSTRDIESFANLAGIKGMFPSLSGDFLRDLFDQTLQTSLLVKGHHFEDLSGKEPLFQLLQDAIVNSRQIRFNYQKQDETEKSYAEVDPYKLVNHKGIWYLTALHDNKLKTFSFTKLRKVHAGEIRFNPSPEILRQIEDEDGIWVSDEKKEVVIKVSREVADYFKRRRLISNQKVEKELEDGGLIISAHVSHHNQVMPIVRYWIPHLRIISPEGLQKELETELAGYILPHK